jgi:hypothetical protein
VLVLGDSGGELAQEVLLNRTGYVLDLSTPDYWAEQIGELIGNPSLKEVARRARAYYKAVYDPNVLVSAWIELLKLLLSKSFAQFPEQHVELILPRQNESVAAGSRSRVPELERRATK